ncbi:hypothetical protein NL676_000025 [Syzygium grande]|nr:hypothetical protein NL676_000025 [Syzygium grande]
MRRRCSSQLPDLVESHFKSRLKTCAVLSTVSVCRTLANASDGVNRVRGEDEQVRPKVDPQDDKEKTT